ncbi:MAG TPA: integration host factor, actinobacterial type [Solirubrobacterales bacterium]
MTTPFGRRLCEVVANRDTGGYRVVSLRDREGSEPRPGQFYMLAAAEGWGEVTPGAAGAVLVGGGVGVAPLALWRRHLSDRGIPHRVLLGFRDRAHTGGPDLFCGSSGALCPEVRLATEDGHSGLQGRVTDLLLPILAGDHAASGVVYSCGPPAMLDAVRSLCEAHDVRSRAAPTPPSSSPSAPRWWRSAPRASATLGPARASPWNWSTHSSPSVRPTLRLTSTRGRDEFTRKWVTSACVAATHGYTRRRMTTSSVKTSLAAPERSLDQRMEALKRANDIRTARAKLKKDLKASRASIHAILLDPPEYVMTAKVFDMLLAVPKYGRVKTNRILNQCRISPSKTIGGLSERQRTELVSLLRR